MLLKFPGNKRGREILKNKGFPEILILKTNRVWREYRRGLLRDNLEEKDKSEEENFPEDWIASTVKATNPNREEFIKKGFSKVIVFGKGIY